MNLIRKKIEKIIYSGKEQPVFSLATPLWFLSIIFGWISWIRAGLYRIGIFRTRKVPGRVISIGNITAGGTGKTPMTLYLTMLLKKSGYNTAIVTRGYRGTLEKTGGIVSDGKQVLVNAKDAGDEPFMIAGLLKNTPVIAGKDRVSSAWLAITKFRTRAIVLDDGFQHLRIKRDIDLVMLDYKNPLGNGHVIPRGTLREPLSGLKRADAFVFTRSEPDPNIPEAVARRLGKKPVFFSTHEPLIRKWISGTNNGSNENAPPFSGKRLYGKNAFLFSGIAKNREFHRTAESFGCRILGTCDFPDHYPYKEKDLLEITRQAVYLSVDVIVTTEKDAVRIDSKFSWPLPLVVIGIQIRLADEQAFNDFILERLEKD